MMPLYLSDCPIGICDRCSQKRPWRMLIPDGNSSGLRVCSDRDCFDILNPWRLAPIRPDHLSLKWSRPDVPLDAGIPYPDYTNPVNPVPPANTFDTLEGFEGINATIEQEGGGGISMEGDP